MKKDFQDVFLLFRCLARRADFRSESELAKSIAAFAKKNGIQQQIVDQPPAHYYFTRQQLVNYLI
jgi:hypothetical protein